MNCLQLIVFVAETFDGYIRFSTSKIIWFVNQGLFALTQAKRKLHDRTRKWHCKWCLFCNRPTGLNFSVAFEIAAFLVFVAELPHDAFFVQTFTLFHSISQFWSAHFCALDLTLAALTWFHDPHPLRALHALHAWHALHTLHSRFHAWNTSLHCCSFSDTTNGKGKESQRSEQEISHYIGKIVVSGLWSEDVSSHCLSEVKYILE